MRHIDCHALTHDPDLAPIHDQILDWFREHGVDPKVAAIAKVGDRSMRVTEYVLSKDGLKMLDANDPDRAMTRTRHVRIRSPFPVEEEVSDASSDVGSTD